MRYVKIRKGKSSKIKKRDIQKQTEGQFNRSKDRKMRCVQIRKSDRQKGKRKA